MQEQQRYQIMELLGLVSDDEAALWNLLDVVEAKPAKEAQVLTLLEKALMVDAQRFFQVTDEAGLTKAGSVEFDALRKCRAIGEGESIYQKKLADLIGWKYPVTESLSNTWF